jgi:beta,beta-carotene 9',10'-dioxygenase
MARKFTLGFSTLDKEIILNELPLVGEIPSWLKGTLVRNGPAKFEIGKKKLKHWFDGFAMLHKFSFSGGRVSYANKFLESKAYRYTQKNQKLGYSEFATDPCRSIFKRFAQDFIPKPTDNGNVNVSQIAKHFVALTEIPLPVEFDKETLETVGLHSYEDTLKGNLTTAHPHFDFEKDEGINYLTKFGLKSSYSAYRIPSSSNARGRIGSIAVKEPSYMHSFGLSRHYIILVEYPFVVNPIKLLISGKPFIENFTWKPKKGTRFTLIEKETGEVIQRHTAEAFFAFHHVNAFESEENLFVDIVGYPDVGIIQSLYLDALRGEAGKSMLSAGQLRRYKLDLTGNTVSYRVVAKDPIELPRINYTKCNTNNYKFVYGTGSDAIHPENFLDRLVKINVQTGKATIWKQRDCYPGEPIFIEKPNAQEEDEGIVLSVVLNSAKHNSFLLLLDATTFQELCRAEVPHHIPFGFHGQYFN